MLVVLPVKHFYLFIIAGIVCGVTVGGVVVIAVIVIITCKLRLDLKFYLLYGTKLYDFYIYANIKMFKA